MSTSTSSLSEQVARVGSLGYLPVPVIAADLTNPNLTLDAVVAWAIKLELPKDTTLPCPMSRRLWGCKCGQIGLRGRKAALLHIQHEHLTVPADPLIDVLAVPCCKTCSNVSVDLARCSACRSAVYCSVSCQRNDWSTHQHECRQLGKQQQEPQQQPEQIQSLTITANKVMPEATNMVVAADSTIPMRTNLKRKATIALRQQEADELLYLRQKVALWKAAFGTENPADALAKLSHLLRPAV